MLKKIEKPEFFEISGIPSGIYRSHFDSWFKAHIEPLNKLIREAVELTGFKITKDMYTEDKNIGKWTWGEGEDNRSTHKLWGIGIEPINKETPADVLKEMLENDLHGDELYNRAKLSLSNHEEEK